MLAALIILGFAACAVTSLALGLAAVRALGLDVNRAEAVCLGYVLGSAAASVVSLAVAALFLARTAVFAGIAICAAILLWRQLGWWRTLKPAQVRVPPAIGCIFTAAWLAYGFLYFHHAMSPEMSPDGMAYHLGLVNLWAHAHGLTKNISMYAALPDGVEMLYLLAFTIGRHSSA